MGVIRTGEHGGYRWLTGTDRYIGDFVRLCADAILGRYVAVTMIDSGTPWLTDAQKERGWELRDGIAYSPAIASTDELLFQVDGENSPGYDEWFLFDAEPANLGKVAVSVNSPRFVLHQSDESDVCRTFWTQIERIRPDAYIGDGEECLTFVCRWPDRFAFVAERLRGS